ncbi:MAG: hypothetical protein IH608_11065 [Proteobacteria bacterium]|nr:hypothetical protein [Pseudomonadota bacterium]
MNGVKRSIDLWDGVFDLDVDWRTGENSIAIGPKGSLRKVSFSHDPYVEGGSRASVHDAIFLSCANCHVMGEERDLKLRKPAKALCGICHKQVSEGFEHDAEKVPCILCHEEHVAAVPDLLRTPTNSFCKPCHEKLETGKETHHKAVDKTFLCSNCHHKPLLNGVCHSCHAAKVKDRGTVHSRAVQKKQCIQCHVPHAAGPNAMAVTCKGCHGEMAALAKGHAEVTTVRCGACHAMHADGAYRDTGKACGGCHPNPSASEHRAASGACRECHRIHSAKGG